MKQKIDIDQIKHLYYHEKKSAPQVAEILGCEPQVIYARMKKHGMQRRSYSEAHQLRGDQKDSDVNDAEIVRLYFEEHLSLKDVSEQLGITIYNVQKRLRDQGYKTRNKADSQRLGKLRPSKLIDVDRAEIERLYYEAGQSVREIAYQYNCAETAVRTYFKRQGIRFRTVKEAQTLRRNREKGRKEVPKELKASPRTYTPPKRAGKVFDPYPVLSAEQVTPERILQLHSEEDLMIDDIAEICSLSTVEVYHILQEMRGT